MKWCFLLSNFSFNHFFQLFSLFVCWLFFSCLLFLVFNSVYLTRTSFKGLHNIGVIYKSLKVSHKRNLTFKCKWINKRISGDMQHLCLFFQPRQKPSIAWQLLITSSAHMLTEVWNKSSGNRVYRCIGISYYEFGKNQTRKWGMCWEPRWIQTQRKFLKFCIFQ